MARIAYITKYPPLEGGIAAKSYWLSHALADRGHSIVIITDPVDVDPIHRIEGGEPADYPGIKIRRFEKEIPWHIPNDQHRTEGLLELTLRAIEEEHCDVILAGYLVPYGIVAYLASRALGVPYVLQHGGSDLNKFIASGLWESLWAQVFSHAALLITDTMSLPLVEGRCSTLRVCHPYVPNPAFFSAQQRIVHDRPSLALIGKANYYWNHKGWDKVLELWKRLPDNYTFEIVAQGVGLKDFMEHIPSSVLDRCKCRPFVPPWEMPRLLNQTDGLFLLQGDLPHPIFSNLGIEMMACGGQVITDISIPKLMQNGGTNRDYFNLNMKLDNSNDFEKRMYGTYSMGGIDEIIDLYDEYVSINEECILQV